MSHRSRPALLLLSFSIALLLFLGFNLGLVQGSILGEITVCDVGCDHVTIRDAIAQAQTGDTIDVASGIYTETLTISRSLTLQGAGKELTSLMVIGQERLSP